MTLTTINWVDIFSRDSAGGKAVFKARALYSLINNNVKFDDFELCGSSSERKRSDYKAFQGDISYIYPNPTSNVFTLYFNLLNFTDGLVQITNMFGQVVKQIHLTGERGTLKVEMSDLNQGVYYYQIIDSENTIRKKEAIILVK